MFRPRFQFRLSTLFWLVVLLGAVFAWVGYNVRIVRERQALKPHIDNSDGFSLTRVETEMPDEPVVPWIRRILGDSPERDLFYSPSKDLDGSQFQKVRRLFPEARIWGWPRDKSELPEGVQRFPLGATFSYVI